MRKIFKYDLKVADTQEVLLPAGAQVLTVQVQSSKHRLWAWVDPDAEPEPFPIHCFGTGNDLPTGNQTYNYISTTQEGSLVWHWFRDGIV